MEHALKNFTHQGTCCDDVIIKVIWFDYISSQGNEDILTTKNNLLEGPHWFILPGASLNVGSPAYIKLFLDGSCRRNAAGMQLPCQHTVSTYYIFQLQNEIILEDTEANDDQSNEVCPSPFTTFEFKN